MGFLYYYGIIFVHIIFIYGHLSAFNCVGIFVRKMYIMQLKMHLLLSLDNNVHFAFCNLKIGALLNFNALKNIINSEKLRPYIPSHLYPYLDCFRYHILPEVCLIMVINYKRNVITIIKHTSGRDIPTNKKQHHSCYCVYLLN